MRARVDQLRFADDTRFGLFLVLIYLVLESWTSAHLLGFYFAKALGGLQWLIPVVQPLLLIIGCLLICLCRAIWLRRTLNLRELQTLPNGDKDLSNEASYLGHRICNGRAKFYITGRIDDGNAFCFPVYPRIWIIIGGAFRVLFRKTRDEAKAVIAHECFHVQKGDTLLLVVTWYLFVAFGILASSATLIMQVEYWIKVASLNWASVTHEAFWRTTLQILITAVRNGGPTLIGWLFTGLILLHFIRQREYIADEGAAQYGLRGALSSTLHKQADHISHRGFYQRFHPTSKDRLERLSTGNGWGRMDLLLCFAATSLAIRMIDAIPSIPGVVLPRADTPSETFFDDLATSLGGYGNLIMIFTAFFLVFGMLIFLLAHHVYRVTITRRAKHMGVASSVSAAFLASLAGCLVGTFSSIRSIQAILGGLNEGNVLHQIDQQVVTFCFSTAFTTMFLGASFLMGVFAATMRPLARPWALACFSACWFVLAALIQMLVNVVCMVGTLGSFIPWTAHISIFPEASTRVVANHCSPIGGAFSGIAVLFLILGLYSFGSALFRRRGSLSVHAARMIIDRFETRPSTQKSNDRVPR